VEDLVETEVVQREDVVERPGQSLEDKLAERFRPDLKDEPEPEAEEVDDDPPEVIEELEPTVEGAEAEEIEFEGTVYQVPAELKDAFLKNKDYTEKTQTLAEKRREVELKEKQVEVTQKEQQFIGEIQPELNNIGYLDAQINQMTQDLSTNLSILTSEEMFKKKIEVDGLKEQREALAQGLQVKYKEFEEAQQQSYTELLEQGSQILKKAIPDWNEEKQATVRDYALSKGLTQQEVSSIIDPRHVQILWAASQYDALQRGVDGAKVKVKSAPVIQPKARSPKQTDNDKKLAIRNKLKSGKLTDREKADLILQEAGERFG
jgi:hypothetical protein